MTKYLTTEVIDKRLDIQIKAEDESLSQRVLLDFENFLENHRIIYLKDISLGITK